ncbi:HAMP domain-containing protein [Williamwhitmania taraxaci]|uniref:HAMP domain-containing protein n=1 Tax=Williamwhitmania taraxaci TaxID=1640674 RepID=A0A1G6H5J4_9BACT|nr:hypothetical protein [Williamwhitmania taraxaci]SDB89394.1 hypothetical protein SAMN05216323_100723 [Williamwhitmania taraxaci]
MGIKGKILSGFVLLGFVLLISGAMSIYLLTTVGKSVSGLLHENYKSIEISKGMLDALEQENSGLLQVLAGNVDSGFVQLSGGRELFHAGILAAMGNLTIAGEKELVDSIRMDHAQFDSLLSGLSVRAEVLELDRKWYVTELNPAYNRVSKRVKSLMTINETAIIANASDLENNTYRAIMPGIIAICAGFFLTILFNLFLNHYFLSPIVKLTRAVDDFVKHKIPFDVVVETKDEIGELRDAIATLVTQAKKGQKTNPEN